MSLTVVKNTGGEKIPLFQKVIELAQGGFTLTTTGLVAAATVKKGTLMTYDESTRNAAVLKQAVMQDDAADDAVDYKVVKGHHLAVGDIIACASNGAKYAITAIVTTETAYDTVTLGTTLGVALTAGDVVFESSGTAGASGAALKSTPNGMLYEDAVVGANEPLSVFIRGTVYKRRIPNGIHALAQAALTHIIFSDSY